MFKRLFKCISSFATNKQNWLSLIAGASLVFAYAPFELWWLPFLVLPLWLNQLVKSDHKISFTYAFGIGWFTSGISWVHISIADFGGMPLVISLLLMFMLCLYLAIYPALASGLTRFLSKKLHLATDFNLWLLPPAWLVAEYLRSVVMTGFPWLSLGYSQTTSPLNTLAPIIGETGLSFFILFICVAFANLIKQRDVKFSSIIILFSGITIVYSSFINWVQPTNKQITTALVQGNIAQELKWLPEKEWPTLERYLALTEAQKNIDLFIWPESAIPALEPTVQDYLAFVNESAANNNSAIITGIINYNYEFKSFFNSLIVLGKKQEQQLNGDYSYGHNNRYNKNHLLPIGEFVPFGDILRPIAPLFNLPMSSFARGNYVQNNLIAKDIHILPLICFEIAFPEQLSANFTPKTQLLLTVSNDAWFADSHGPHQHMEIAKMRALEFGRPLVRSTNTGVTAAVDHLGRIVNQLPQFEEGVLISNISLVTGDTPFSIYGTKIIYLFSLLFTIMIFIRNKLIKH